MTLHMVLCRGSSMGLLLWWRTWWWQRSIIIVTKWPYYILWILIVQWRHQMASHWYLIDFNVFQSLDGRKTLNILIRKQCTTKIHTLHILAVPCLMNRTMVWLDIKSLLNKYLVIGTCHMNESIFFFSPIKSQSKAVHFVAQSPGKILSGKPFCKPLMFTFVWPIGYAPYVHMQISR